jgi:two-component system response regulator QseB
MRVLVVEDDPMIGRAVVAGLNDNGYDVALLDLGLPRRDGLELLKALRRAKNELPILVITARDSVPDRVAGLDSGADDYLVKPFDLDELVARTRAVIRRRTGRALPEITYGPLMLDPVKRRVRFQGAEVELSAREFAVLEALMKEPGAVVSRERLEDAVYGWGEEVGSNSIEVHLHHLRRKLKPELIRNVRGVGYRIALLQ